MSTQEGDTAVPSRTPTPAPVAGAQSSDSRSIEPVEDAPPPSPRPSNASLATTSATTETLEVTLKSQTSTITTDGPDEQQDAHNADSTSRPFKPIVSLAKTRMKRRYHRTHQADNACVTPTNSAGEVGDRQPKHHPYEDLVPKDRTGGLSNVTVNYRRCRYRPYKAVVAKGRSMKDSGSEGSGGVPLLYGMCDVVKQGAIVDAEGKSVKRPVK